MTKENKLKLKIARSLVTKIGKEYQKIDPSSDLHDQMLYQRRGAWETLGEIEYYLEKESYVIVDQLMGNLKDTLKACKTANKAQDLLDSIEFIYG